MVNMMHLYFLAATVFSTVIGSAVEEAHLPSENLISFVPLDLELNPNQVTYPVALGSQSSNDQIFQEFAVPDQMAPNLAIGMAIVPSAPVKELDEKVHKIELLLAKKGGVFAVRARTLL